MLIYVIDTETTGLNGSPKDLVLEISIVEVDLETKETKKVYDSVIGYDTSEWSDYLKEAWIFYNSTLTIEDIEKASPLDQVIDEVKEIVKDKIITSFNTGYDLYNFLFRSPWKLKDIIKGVAPCIMLSATNVCKIPVHWNDYDYKWPNLEEAYEILVQDETTNNEIQPHRALGDTIMASKVLLELYPKNYNLEKIRYHE